MTNSTLGDLSLCIGLVLERTVAYSEAYLDQRRYAQAPKTSGAGTTQPAKLKLPWQAGRPSLRRPVRRVGAAS